MPCRTDAEKKIKYLFSFLPVKVSIKLIPFFLGLIIGAQIALSYHIDIFFESSLKSYLGLKLPHPLHEIPFKSISILFFCLLSFVILIIFIRKNIPWFIKNKEKILIVSIITSTQIKSLTGNKIEITDLIILVVSFWLFIFIMKNDNKIPWNLSFSLILVLLCSVLLSYTNGGIVPFILTFPSVLKSFLAFFIMLNIVTNRERVIFSLKIFLIVMTLSAIIGIMQELILMTTGIAIVGNIPEHTRLYMWETTSFGQLLRVPAFTGWYILFSGYLLIAIMLGINLRLYSVVTEKKKRFLLDIAITLMFVALYLTFSNSALLSALIGVVISLFIRWRSLTIYFIVAIFIGILVAHFSGVAIEVAKDPKKYLLTKDINVRIELLRNGYLGFINQHPFLGVGIGKGNRYCGDVNSWPVHNNIMLVADECGILGVFAYGVFLLSVIYRNASSIFILKNKKDKVILLSLLMGLLVYMINLQAQPSYIEVFLFVYLGIIEAATGVMLRPIHTKTIRLKPDINEAE